MQLSGSFGWKDDRIFNNHTRSVEEIVENVVRCVSEWASKGDEFEGIFLEDLKS